MRYPASSIVQPECMTTSQQDGRRLAANTAGLQRGLGAVETVAMGAHAEYPCETTFADPVPEPQTQLEHYF